MREDFTEGRTTTRRITVDRDRTIDFMGEDCRVYATPELVRDIEMTCRDWLKQQVDAHEDSVGTRVEIDHVAATLLGMWVDIQVKVSQLQGRAISFEFECRDALEICASGVHNRFVVDVEKTAQRLRAKAQQAGNQP